MSLGHISYDWLLKVPLYPDNIALCDLALMAFNFSQATLP